MEENHYTVYKLTDPMGKVYIGCTGRRVKQRWHRGQGYRQRMPVFQAVETYGWDAIKKEILCEKLTREGAERLERWFINYYDSANPEKGYNRFLGGLGKNVRMSETTRVLLQEKKKKLFSEHPEKKEQIRQQMRAYLAQTQDSPFVNSSRRARPLVCVETGERYPSERAAERRTGLSGIHKVCLGRRNTCGGYHWRFADEEKEKTAADLEESAAVRFRDKD